MTRDMGDWRGSNDGKLARARREAVQVHVDARITAALREPRKADLLAELAEAARNTAELTVTEKEISSP